MKSKEMRAAMNQTETFIKLKRSDNFRKLLKSHHNELILLLVISSRARRVSETCSFTGLSQNQALIGDHAEYGMTERQYRTAKKNLEKWNFSTFKGTSKGTIATLTDASICDINCEQGATNETDDRRTGDGRVTTNKNDKKEKNVNKFIKPSASQVLIYMRERCPLVPEMKLAQQSEKFVNYHEGNGWKRGKTPIKDWKACARTWIGNDYDKTFEVKESKRLVL